MDSLVQPLLHSLESALALALLTALVVGWNKIVDYLAAKAASSKDAVVTTALEAAVAYAERVGGDKLKVALAKAETLLGFSVDEAQVEGVLAKMKALNAIPASAPAAAPAEAPANAAGN